MLIFFENLIGWYRRRNRIDDLCFITTTDIEYLTMEGICTPYYPPKAWSEYAPTSVS
ncbi:hypothetical protein JCM19239_1199 [Vibrio variabilis]|uniref:Uncharacterized protein n=1 Tax=Vibrio variabilis TaxID=990271 RepID=A0ABQ0JAR6_9VIBR|nr:hypothetical protein JCM19239_1199 [Vibrio variabilis]